MDPLANEAVMISTATGERHTAFHEQTPEQKAIVAEFLRRGETGALRMEVITPDLWAPLPGIP